jgi:class 3 adenylate cyclase
LLNAAACVAPMGALAIPMLQPRLRRRSIARIQCRAHRRPDDATDIQTFVFADLVGFTTLTELRGDLDAARVARRFHQLVRELLPMHRACAVKGLGDGVMLRSRDAQDGVRIALAIAGACRREPDFPEVRVGAHTGPAVRNGRDWYGATVNVAARVCTTAEPGQVLLTEATVKAAGTLTGVELTDRSARTLRHVSEPVVLHAAHGLSVDAETASRRGPLVAIAGGMR